MKNSIDQILEAWQFEAMALKVVGKKVFVLVQSNDGYDILKNVTTNSYRGRYSFQTVEDAKVFWDDYNGAQIATVGKAGCVIAD